MAFVAIVRANPLAWTVEGGRRSQLPRRNHIATPNFAFRIHASSPSTTPKPQKLASLVRNTLACPVCYAPLISLPSPKETEEVAAQDSCFVCNTCRKSYNPNETYLDLTVATNSKGYEEFQPPSAELFRSPVVSFLYERGWRQNFVLGGFPGPEKEQCNDFATEEGLSKEDLFLVRADIARMPFVSGSIDAVHAGAALHCWPSPSAAVSEISRILRPGGVFVATTFILDGIISFLRLPTVARQFYGSFTGQHLYFSETELEDLCRLCGLVNFTCVRNASFVMLSAIKPH
ncbi:putative methyltransferase At1g78140, chloroplastic [Wolffia australiana]